MSPQQYFETPHHLAFHDFTPGRQLPPATKLVLGLSFKFVPRPEASTTRKKAMEAFERLENLFNWRVHFTGKDSDHPKSKKMYVKSNLIAPVPPPAIGLRLSNFELRFKKLFGNRPKLKSNLPKYLQRLLERLRSMKEIIFAQADKNLGPVAVTLEQYIKDALVHLSDPETYELLTESEARARDEELRLEIRRWLIKFSNSVELDARNYIRSKLDETESDPFGYFYLLYKIHKSPLKTRPVCSDCASTPHALGIWVDSMLQPIVKAMPSYFKDSFTLTKILRKLKLSGKCSIFSFDAISMYTKINTEDCLARLSAFLLNPSTQERFPHYPAKALVEALALVMKNNRMKFGDLFVQQLIGIAMGMSPAPTIANLYVAIFEVEVILPLFKEHLPLYLRFIDDGLAVWQHCKDKISDAKLIESFKAAINRSGLRWTFTPLDNHVEFMDLNISLDKGHFSTNLFEKPMALHLYIPPHSCHPPGCFRGLLTGMVLRIYRLCSYKKDIDKWLSSFYGYLLDRGYQHKIIKPLFLKATIKAQEYVTMSDEYRLQQKTLAQKSNNMIFLHLKYNPADPSSSYIQKLWREIVVQPKNKPHITHLKNYFGERFTTSRLVIAYSRHPNIGNLLSYRKICNRPGLKVSSYL